MTGNEKKSGKIFKRIGCVLLAIVLLAAVATGGYLIAYYAQDPSARTLRWVKNMVEKYYYVDFTGEELEEATMEDLFGSSETEAMLDQYSAYYTAEQYAAQRSTDKGNQSGVGLSFLANADGSLQIYRVLGNSPADDAGLAAGMYVRGYGGDEASIEYDFQPAELTAYISALPAEEEFVLTVSLTADGEEEAYTLYKTEYTRNYVFYADSELSYRFTGDAADVLTEGTNAIEALPEDTAYIRLDSFTGDAADQFAGMLEVFASRGKKRLILDLRNNGGGQTTVLGEIAACLCKDAPGKNFTVMTAQYKGGESSVFRADTNRYTDYFSSDSEIYVMANRNTASASEALLGAMLDYGTIEYDHVFLSEIDGEARSYGKGIMQTTYYNPLTGEAVKLTTATIHWPVSGNCIQDRGILVEDGAISLPAAGEVDYADLTLQTLVSQYLA